MSTHIKDYRRVTDVRDDQVSRPVHAAADPTTQQVHAGADQSTQRALDSMVQLVRQGLNTSLKSVQVWADLARQVNTTALGYPADARMVSRAYDPFEALLAAQRELVGDLVATQRQLTQHLLDTTASDHSARQ
jgi:hypothetical protein